jgi:hypothetical protein
MALVRRQKSTKKKQVNPSVGSIVYVGPSKLPRAAVDDDTYTAELKYIGTMAASAGGVLAPVLDSYSQLTSSPDWANAAALYQEYRVLSMETHLQPWNKYNTPTTSALAPVYSVLDRVNATALASLSDCAGYASVKIHPPSTEIVRTIKMADSGEAQFIATTTFAATTDRLYIKFYSAGNAASITMYDYVTTILVQFRGRK